MSRFLSGSLRRIAPYAPGEQPRDQRYIKLNTNECPYPPSPYVRHAVAHFDSADLRLYPHPDVWELREEMAAFYGLEREQVLASGGSDEALAYAFMAFFDRGDPVCFPDITYGFYQVYAELFGLEAREIPLREDFTVGLEDYQSLEGNLFLANPNAPTGIALERREVERILQANPDRLIVVDEAYIDFAADGSCAELVNRYDNLLVVQTFSKSRALAGMRLGFLFGNRELIAGLERVRYSFNPYNLDRISVAVGIAAIRDESYLKKTVDRVTATRERAASALLELGFQVLPSSANFLFVRKDGLDGELLYRRLKERGILVRHFGAERIREFNRVTIGTDQEMDRLLEAVREICIEEGCL